MLYIYIILRVVPLIKIWLAKRKKANTKKEGGSEDASIPWYVVESTRPNAGDVTEEYKEIAIMYGYVVLFTAAFPLAPLISLFTTGIEVRSDAYKMTIEKRPIPKKVADIGTWEDVFEIVSQIAIITNLGLLAFASKKGWLTEQNLAMKWAVLVLIEHVVLAVVGFIKVSCITCLLIYLLSDLCGIYESLMVFCPFYFL